MAAHALTDAEALDLVADDTAWAEFELPPLTAEERLAVAEYVRQTVGVWDSFDSLERVDLDGFPLTATLKAVREYVDMLHEWQSAQLELSGSTLDVDTGGTSAGITRFLERERDRWAESRRVFYRALLATLVGRRDPSGLGDSAIWTITNIRD